MFNCFFWSLSTLFGYWFMDFVLLTFIGKFIFLVLNIFIITSGVPSLWRRHTDSSLFLSLFLSLNHFHWLLLKLIHFLDYFLSYLWSRTLLSNYWTFIRSNIHTHDLKMLLMKACSSSCLTTIWASSSIIR